MKILVTGGAGFIGSHLVDALIDEKHSVVIIDNLATGKKVNLNPNAAFYQADITQPEEIIPIFQKEEPAIVFHLAAQMNVRKSVDKPIFDSKTNILGSLVLIELAKKYNIKKFVFSSTGGVVYGDTPERPTPETFREEPLCPYGISKLTIDRFLHYNHQVFGFNSVSLRYGNVYGPRQNPQGEAGVVAIFISQMLAGKQPVINGDGLQTRDYVYVEDVVRANLAALNKIETSGIFNVGNGQEVSVNQIFSEINKRFDNKFEEFHGPEKLGEQKTSCLDTKKIQSVLDWKPQISLEEGIKRTFEWFKSNE